MAAQPHVLIVEDEEAQREVLAYNLESEGFRISEAEDGDAALFGLLWPLGESVKLDSTIDRRTLRAQIARLGELGYALDFKTQEWSRQAELQPA